MRTQAAGSFHENHCFMGQFHQFMTIQPIFDATAFSCSFTFSQLKISSIFPRAKTADDSIPVPRQLVHYSASSSSQIKVARSCFVHAIRVVVRVTKRTCELIPASS